MPRTFATLAALAALTALAGCGAAPPMAGEPEPAADVAQPAADAIRALEQRLIAATEVSLEFTVESTGAVPAVFRGSARLRGDTEAELYADGRVRGAPLSIELVADARAMRGRGAGLGFEQPTPPDLNEALLRGMVRMGWIHHLAVLASGSPPDGVHGAIVETTTIERLRNGADGELVFDMHVGGELSATVQLWLDDRGLPRRRRQTSRSPRGEIIVVERYTRLELTTPAAAPAPAPGDEGTETTAPPAR